MKTNDASDARLLIKTPAGANAAVAIASKRQLDPSLVPAAADALKTVAADGFLVVSPFLGARTRERLLARGIGYVDLAGNVRLAWIARASSSIGGGRKNPWAKTRGTRSFDGPKASRLVRALCDRSPPFGVRQLAARAETDPGYVSRLLGVLEREELVRRNERGAVAEVDVPGLIRRWATEYRFLEANRAVLCHDIGGPRALLCRLREAEIPTPSPGAPAPRCSPVSRCPAWSPATSTTRSARRGARVRPVRDGANVVLLEPFDPVVFPHTWERDGVRHAAQSQIVADLLGSPSPGPQEAATLLGRLKSSTKGCCGRQPVGASGLGPPASVLGTLRPRASDSALDQNPPSGITGAEALNPRLSGRPERQTASSLQSPTCHAATPRFTAS